MLILSVLADSVMHECFSFDPTYILDHSEEFVFMKEVFTKKSSLDEVDLNACLSVTIFETQ